MFGICLLIFIGLCIYHACEKELPADYHNNWRLEAHDSQLVREGKMTQRQFEKNMNNGKYRQEGMVQDMETLIGLAVIIAIFAIPNMITNHKLDNYDISKIDNAKLSRDAANGVSVAERRRRCVNGYYDKK